MSMIYSILNPIFSPILVLGNVLAILTLAIIINLISSILTKVFVDTKRMKEIQAEVKKYRKAISSGDESAKKNQARMMELQQELMQLQFPMFFTIFPILLVFIWMRTAFADTSTLINLPYAFPYFGDALGWLGWYILCSLPTSSLIRKLMRI